MVLNYRTKPSADFRSWDWFSSDGFFFEIRVRVVHLELLDYLKVDLTPFRLAEADDVVNKGGLRHKYLDIKPLCALLEQDCRCFHHHLHIIRGLIHCLELGYIMVAKSLCDNRYLCNQRIELHYLTFHSCMLVIDPLLLFLGLSFHRFDLVFEFDNLLHHVEVFLLLQKYSLERLLVLVTIFLRGIFRPQDFVWCLSRCFPCDLDFRYLNALIEFNIVHGKTWVEMNSRFRFWFVTDTDLSFTIAFHRWRDFLLKTIDLFNNSWMKFCSRRFGHADRWSPIPAFLQLRVLLPWRTR